jgi:hypothetical protein
MRILTGLRDGGSGSVVGFGNGLSYDSCGHRSLVECSYLHGRRARPTGATRRPSSPATRKSLDAALPERLGRGETEDASASIRHLRAKPSWRPLSPRTALPLMRRVASGRPVTSCRPDGREPMACLSAELPSLAAVLPPVHARRMGRQRRERVRMPPAA